MLINLVRNLINKSYRSYIFEIWVDEAKYLGNLNIATAIESYIHVAFCFDLKYPKV